MEEKKYKVYYLIDPRNGLVKYVGITGSSLKSRLNSHISEAKANRNIGHKNYWINKLASLSLCPIIEIVFDKLTLSEACELEIEAISIFGRKSDGYQLANITLGGEGNLGGDPWNKGMSLMNNPNDKRLLVMSEKLKFRKRKVIRYDLEGTIIDKWDSISELYRETGLDYRLVSAICRKKFGRKSLNGFTFCFDGDTPYSGKELKNKSSSTMVYQYSFDGNFIAGYDSYQDAALAVNGITDAISRCARGKCGSANGYIWRPEFMGHQIELIYKNKKRALYEKDKRVSQFTFDGELVATYNSPVIAAKALNLTKSAPSNIRLVVRGERNHAYGYIWKAA